MDFKSIKDDIETHLGHTDETTLVKTCINRAKRIVDNAIVKLNEDYFVTSKSITLTANYQEWSIAATLLVTDFRKLVRLQDSEGNQITRGDLRTSKDGYYLLGKKTLGYLPKLTANMVCTLYYVQTQSDLSGDTDVPNWDANQMDILYDGGLWKYYEEKKDDYWTGYYKQSFYEKLDALLTDIKPEDSEPEGVQTEDDGLS